MVVVGLVVVVVDAGFVGSGFVVGLDVVGAVASSLRPVPGSSVSVDRAVVHMRAVSVWPARMVASAAPDPPVTLPTINTR